MISIFALKCKLVEKGKSVVSVRKEYGDNWEVCLVMAEAYRILRSWYVTLMANRE